MSEIEELRKKAEEGDPEAQLNLGFMYEQGHGAPRDFVEAARWFRKAADQGNAKAQYQLGFMYTFGFGVPKDLSEAFVWFNIAWAGGFFYAKQGWEAAMKRLTLEQTARAQARAAELHMEIAIQNAKRGNPSAQLNLGLLYAKGQGVPKDDAEAARWFRKAADQGVAYAQYILGAMYADGAGVPQDFVEAYAWTNIASVTGHEKIRKNLETVIKRMTPEQIARAQARSTELHKEIESRKANK